MSYRFDASLITGAFVFGDSGLGVLGSEVPSAGDSGAGYLYNDLLLPADANKEVCGTITTWPTNGTLIAEENSAFTYTPVSNGVDFFEYRLRVDGVWSTVDIGFGPGIAREVLVTGSTPVTLSCSPATATASGFTAGITQATNIACAVGTASAIGFSSSLLQATNINCAPAIATAIGYQATIEQQGIIVCSTGIASAYGFSASVPQASEITCAVAVASASGFGASVSVAGGFSGSLSDADIARIAAAVLAALNATTIPVDAKKMNGASIIGDGSEADPWRGVGVSP